ncbi:MAG: hypothetical protein EP338_03635 [Bacteroidetes bacterium]|nr:MAG: hypothetical protein EP338_03635 [Bacteroidota bacterium]
MKTHSSKESSPQSGPTELDQTGTFQFQNQRPEANKIRQLKSSAAHKSNLDPYQNLQKLADQNSQKIVQGKFSAAAMMGFGFADTPATRLMDAYNDGNPDNLDQQKRTLDDLLAELIRMERARRGSVPRVVIDAVVHETGELNRKLKIRGASGLPDALINVIKQYE